MESLIQSTSKSLGQYLLAPTGYINPFLCPRRFPFFFVPFALIATSRPFSCQHLGKLALLHSSAVFSSEISRQSIIDDRETGAKRKHRNSPVPQPPSTIFVRDLDGHSCFAYRSSGVKSKRERQSDTSDWGQCFP